MAKSTLDWYEEKNQSMSSHDQIPDDFQLDSLDSFTHGDFFE